METRWSEEIFVVDKVLKRGADTLNIAYEYKLRRTNGQPKKGTYKRDYTGPGLGHVTAALRCPAALRCGLAALRSYAAPHTACTITCPAPGVSCPELAALAPALSEAL